MLTAKEFYKKIQSTLDNTTDIDASIQDILMDVNEIEPSLTKDQMLIASLGMADNFNLLNIISTIIQILPKEKIEFSRELHNFYKNPELLEEIKEVIEVDLEKSAAEIELCKKITHLIFDKTQDIHTSIGIILDEVEKIASNLTKNQKDKISVEMAKGFEHSSPEEVIESISRELNRTHIERSKVLVSICNSNLIDDFIDQAMSFPKTQDIAKGFRKVFSTKNFQNCNQFYKRIDFPIYGKETEYRGYLDELMLNLMSDLQKGGEVKNEDLLKKYIEEFFWIDSLLEHIFSYIDNIKLQVTTNEIIEIRKKEIDVIEGMPSEEKKQIIENFEVKKDFFVKVLENICKKNSDPVLSTVISKIKGERNYSQEIEIVRDKITPLDRMRKIVDSFLTGEMKFPRDEIETLIEQLSDLADADSSKSEMCYKLIELLVSQADYPTLKSLGEALDLTLNAKKRKFESDDKKDQVNKKVKYDISQEEMNDWLKLAQNENWVMLLAATQKAYDLEIQHSLFFGLRALAFYMRSDLKAAYDLSKYMQNDTELGGKIALLVNIMCMARKEGGLNENNQKFLISITQDEEFPVEIRKYAYITLLCSGVDLGKTLKISCMDAVYLIQQHKELSYLQKELILRLTFQINKTAGIDTIRIIKSIYKTLSRLTDGESSNDLSQELREIFEKTGMLQDKIDDLLEVIQKEIFEFFPDNGLKKDRLIIPDPLKLKENLLFNEELKQEASKNFTLFKVEEKKLPEEICKKYDNFIFWGKWNELKEDALLQYKSGKQKDIQLIGFIAMARYMLGDLEEALFCAKQVYDRVGLKKIDDKNILGLFIYALCICRENPDEGRDLLNKIIIDKNKSSQKEVEKKPFQNAFSKIPSVLCKHFFSALFCLNLEVENVIKFSKEIEKKVFSLAKIIAKEQKINSYYERELLICLIRSIYRVSSEWLEDLMVLMWKQVSNWKQKLKEGLTHLDLCAELKKEIEEFCNTRLEEASVETTVDDLFYDLVEDMEEIEEAEETKNLLDKIMDVLQEETGRFFHIQIEEQKNHFSKNNIFK